MYLLKRKQMKKRKSMKIFWVRKLYHENEKERKILETLLWIFNCRFNTTIAFLYIITPVNMKKKISMVGPNFVKE